MMDTRIKDRLYDRLAGLAQGDEGRLGEYLADQDAPSQEVRDAAARRQRDLRDRRRAAGGRSATLWLTKDQATELRKRYPGERDGINWPGVLDAALKGVDDSTTL